MKKYMLPLIFTFFTITTLQLFAGENERDSQATISYIGIKEKGIAFDIIWSNHSGATEVVIRDKSNNIVYKNLFTETDVKKRFYLSKEESGQYSFTVINGKNRVEKTFLISTTFIEHLNVNEIK